MFLRVFARVAYFRAVLTFPFAVRLRRATVVVRLFDDAPADALADELQAWSIEIDNRQTDTLPIEFEINAALFGRPRILVSAEVRVGTHASLHRGDWISTESFGGTADELSSRVLTIALKKVA